MGGVDTLRIELCASKNSELTEQVLDRSAALRITDKENLKRSITMKAIISIMRIATNNNIKIYIWASTLVLLVALGGMSMQPLVAKQAK